MNIIKNIILMNKTYFPIILKKYYFKKLEINQVLHNP